LQLIDLKTVIVTSLATVSTWLCVRHDFRADFPMTLIGTAVIFPVVFSISGAYKRREAVLDRYGTIKAHGRAIYLEMRDWTPSGQDLIAERVKTMLGDVLKSSRELFSQPTTSMVEAEARVCRIFSELSQLINTGLRGSGVSSGEVSRCNQYLSKMLDAFEKATHIYQYRTPRTLRLFSGLFITILPPLYGPYFAHIAEDYSAVLVYTMPVLFSLVLVSLDKIQSQLENPFDQRGEDDVHIDAEKFRKLLAA
jgi:hypothetical protein